MELKNQPVYKGVHKTLCTSFRACAAFFPKIIYVVVNFLFQLIFIFPLFWGMVMYANEF